MKNIKDVLHLLKFTLLDIKEISKTTRSTIVYSYSWMFTDRDSDTDDDYEFNSDTPSEFPDPELSPYECGEITEKIEEMVENYSEKCNPLEGIYGESASGIIKETIKTATEETQCVGLNFFKFIIPSDELAGDDQSLIVTCISVCYWCCCETIKKVSPRIAEATINLLS